MESCSKIERCREQWGNARRCRVGRASVSSEHVLSTWVWETESEGHTVRGADSPCPSSLVFHFVETDGDADPKCFLHVVLVQLASLFPNRGLIAWRGAWIVSCHVQGRYSLSQHALQRFACCRLLCRRWPQAGMFSNGRSFLSDDNRRPSRDLYRHCPCSLSWRQKAVRRHFYNYFGDFVIL